jgi:phosphate uptake regulator
MDQRKLIQHGTSSLTISIPNKWLKQRNLKKGDSLYVEEEGNKLIVSTDQALKLNNITIDITDLDRTSALLHVQSLYRFGYNEIEIRFDETRLEHYRKNEKPTTSSVMHYTINRLIGAEIIEETKNKIKIKQVTRELEDDFKVILRRVFLLLKEMSEEFIQAIENNDKETIETMDDKHDNFTKFVSYALRLLNKYGYPDVKKTCFYYHIIASLDKIVDIIKYCARDTLEYKNKANKETIAILKGIHASIELYYDFFYNFDLKKANTLNKNREEIKNKIKKKAKSLPIEEVILLTNMKHILELLLDLTDFRMGLEY